MASIVGAVLMVFVMVLCYSPIIDQVQTNDTCNDLYSDFFNHLSSKTPYRYVANYDTQVVEFNGEYPWSDFYTAYVC